jgi:hypothetical protein
MRPWRASCVLLLAVLLNPPAAAEKPDGSSEALLEPLPSPQLGEGFEIGEALYDPSRVDQAVVSLLDRMGIRIVAAGAPRPSAAGGWELTEAQVRGLIEMGRADAAVAARTGHLPYRFRDLQAAVHALLPDLSVEQLASTYAQAYDAAPDSLVAQVLMGMPIEPGTRLSRPHLWLLLMDGFAPPRGAGKLAQLGPAGPVPAGGPAWGTASLLLPQLPSPDPRWSLADWTYLTAILPLLGFDIPFEMSPANAAGHEGHGGPGASVTLTARIRLRPTPVFSPFTGQPLLVSTAPSLGNVPVTWQVSDPPALASHGSIAGAQGAPAPTDASGSARLVFAPKAERSNGRGEELKEVVSVTARAGLWELLSSHYALPPTLRGFVFGERTIPGTIEVGWHSDGDTIRVSIANEYLAVLELSMLGLGTHYRSGTDSADGTLERQEDGSWRGIVTAHAKSVQQLSDPSRRCSGDDFEGSQLLRVVGDPVSGFSPAQTIKYDPATSGRRGGGFLALEFQPAAAARVVDDDPCQTKPLPPGGSLPFLPLNDARWTLPEARYVIELPTSGLISYSDGTVNTMPGGGMAPGVPVHAYSNWTIRVERTPAAP